MIVEMMVEITKGSRNKYEYDTEKKVIRFDRMLFSAVHYPSDYGFILDTLAEDLIRLRPDAKRMGASEFSVTKDSLPISTQILILDPLR